MLRCVAGYYSSAAGITIGSNYIRPCDAGYVCLGGASIPDPNDLSTGYICPPGSGCPNGTTAQIPCSPGEYNPYFGQGSCISTAAGYYTDTYNATLQLSCPQGSYCPAGSPNPLACAVGSYGAAERLTSQADCTWAPATFYISQPGATSFSLPCAAGIYCEKGAYASTGGENPLVVNGTANGPCPAGYYCEAGVAPIACAAGRFMNITGAHRPPTPVPLLTSSAHCT